MLLRAIGFVSIGVTYALALVKSAPAMALPATSTIYVTAYRCDRVASGTQRSDRLIVLVDDAALEGAVAGSKTLHPTIEDLKPVPGGLSFHFELAPGSYDAFVLYGSCSANGPLVVLPGVDRHLLVEGDNAVTDWHYPLALAGSVLVDGMDVKVLLLSRPAQCGDNPRYYESNEQIATVDHGYYYANVGGYERHDHDLALVLRGALLGKRTILLTQPLGGKNHYHDLVVKNITPNVVQAAALSPNAFACVPGF